MTRYTKEVKAAAVQAAKDGMHLKSIQATIGPNPKAVERYLKKEGINYADLKEQLKKDGKLQGTILEQAKEAHVKRQEKQKADKAQAKSVAKPVVN